jgi:hypothetical protein
MPKVYGEFERCFMIEAAVGEAVECPYCGQSYLLEIDSRGRILANPVTKFCEHLIPNILPGCEHLLPNILPGEEGDSWVVFFLRPPSDNANLLQRLAYLLYSSSPFKAWLMEKREKKVFVGMSGTGWDNPLARFFREKLRLEPGMVWVSSDGAVYVKAPLRLYGSAPFINRPIDGVMYVRDNKYEYIFIPQPNSTWIYRVMGEVNKKQKGHGWTADEVLALL